MKRDTFTLRKTFFKPIANLSDEQLGRLFKAISQYQCGEKPEIADDIEPYFSFFESEFEAEEEKRRRRAEAAAERRRKKIAAANAETKAKPDDKPGETSETPASGFKAEILESKEEIPKLKRRYRDFMENLRYNNRAVYFSGADRLSFEEFLTLRRTMSEKTLLNHIYHLASFSKIGQDEDFFQVLMKKHADSLATNGIVC